MVEDDQTAFTWRGKQTVDAVIERLTPPTRLEIILPEGYNHALFARLHPNAQAAPTEDVDIEGDAQLLHALAGMQGLEPLSGLVAPLAQLAARVSVLSPPRIVIVLE